MDNTNDYNVRGGTQRVLNMTEIGSLSISILLCGIGKTMARQSSLSTVPLVMEGMHVGALRCTGIGVGHGVVYNTFDHFPMFVDCFHVP